MPLWLATPMRPAGGYGATIWAHSVDRRADDALPVRAGEQDAELVGERDQLGLGPPALLARLAVAGRREERGLDALRRAGPQQVGVGRRRRAHEHEVDLAVGELGDVGDGAATPSTSSPCRLVPKTAPCVAGGEEVVQRHEAELARDGSTRRRPARRAARTGRGTARRSGAVARRPTGRASLVAELDERVDGDRPPVGPTISGLTSTLATSGRARRPAAPSPTSDGGQRVPVDGGLAAERAEQRAASRSSSIISCGVDGVDRRRAEHDVGDRLGEDAADAEHHGRAELRVAHARRRSARGCRATIGATSTSTVAVVGRRRGEQLRRRPGATAAASPRPRRTSPRSVLWAMRVAVELGDDREAERVGRGHRLVGASPRRARRRPARRSSASRLLGLGLGQRAAATIVAADGSDRRPAVPPAPRQPSAATAERCVPPARHLGSVGTSGPATERLRSAASVTSREPG